MSFAPIRRTKVADQVAESLRDAILGGRFSTGEALPSERTLADQFAVNRSTVREAIHRLQSEGLVEVRHGGATLVRDFFVTAGMQLLPYMLAPGGSVDPNMLHDLLDMRVMLLGWTARQAALRGSGDIEALRAALHELETAKGADAVQQADFRFFEVQVEMTGNRVLGLLANAVKQVYLENRALFTPLYAQVDLSNHRDTVDAIARGDAEAAGLAMDRWARLPLALFSGVSHGK